MEVYKLIKPIEYDGEKVTKIEMDLDGLTVGDLERCERQARAMLGKGEHMGTPETHKKYLGCVAAKAAHLKLDTIRSLRGSDYTQVCLLVQNFLLGGDSDLTEEDEEADGFFKPMTADTEETMTNASMESQQDWPNFEKQ